MRAGPLFLLGPLLLTAPSAATTLHVPADFPTIQAGLDAAAPADTVLVAPGTYEGPGNNNLDFLGKDLVLLSEAGAETTVISGADTSGSSVRGLHFHSGETRAARVEGFKVMQCSGDFGGAILCEGASPTIVRCVLIGSTAIRGGGIACLSGSAPAIIRCRIVRNFAQLGGGLYIDDAGDVQISGCLISNNDANSPLLRPSGAGIYAVGSSEALGAGSLSIDQSTIAFNRTILGSGAGLAIDAALVVPTTVSRTIVWHNCAGSAGVGGDQVAGGSAITFVCSAVDTGGVSGSPTYSGPQVFTLPMICGPVFCGLTGGTGDPGPFRLRPDSPCLPWNNACGEVIGAYGEGCDETDVPFDPGQIASGGLLVYPNPFAERVAIRFSLPASGPARLEVFDVTGRRIATLVAGVLGAGEREAAWSGRDASGERVPPGVYFARLETAAEAKAARLVLVK